MGWINPKDDPTRHRMIAAMHEKVGSEVTSQLLRELKRRGFVSCRIEKFNDIPPSDFVKAYNRVMEIR